MEAQQQQQRSQQQPAGTPVSAIGEFGLIARMRATLGETTDDDLLSGITDDAAVYRTGEDRVGILTTDALIEGTHFDRTFMPLDHLGVKAISVNVSDVAAMNAQPRYATLTLGLPRGVSVEEVEQLYDGVRQACASYDMAVIGGDTTSAPRLVVSVTVFGEADEKDIVYRKGARPGDALCVTGDLGAAYAGLKVLLEQRQQLREEGKDRFQPDLEAFSYVIQRQLAPSARLGVVRDWKERGVRPRALIDISDGLASEVHHLCESGGVGAKLYGAALPIDPETRRVADRFAEDAQVYGLFGGEDYELLFALPEDRLGALDEQSFVQVGTFTAAEEGVRVEQPEGETVPLQPGGFDHFREDES